MNEITKFNPEIHHRQSIRLRGFDYRSIGAYFVTICSYQRESIFGEIIDGQVNFSSIGNIIEKLWKTLPKHFPNIVLDDFVVMPNHLHAILILKSGLSADTCRGEAFSKLDQNNLSNAINSINKTKPDRTEKMLRPCQGTQPESLGAVIQNFKSLSTRRINKIRQTPGAGIWQRNYYEHIIRDENELALVRNYIVNNPVHWADDEENIR